MSEREQRFVFGEVAEQYDDFRPSYPDESVDRVMAYGALQPGDRALEIGAGTGRATESFVARGLQVHALEPTPAMAEVLRRKGYDVEVVTFEDFKGTDYALVYAATAWHWVYGDDRYERLARCLAPGGVAALMWNIGRHHPEPFKTDNDAVYDRLWPDNGGGERTWQPAGQIAALVDNGFVDVEQHVATWNTEYTADEWIRYLQTASNHRMLPDDVRTEVHAGVHAAVMKHGGVLPVIYDCELYLARKR